MKPGKVEARFVQGALVALVQRVGEVPAGARGFVSRVQIGAYVARYEVVLDSGTSVWCVEQDLEPAMLSLVRGGA